MNSQELTPADPPSRADQSTAPAVSKTGASTQQAENMTLPKREKTKMKCPKVDTVKSLEYD